MTLDSRLFPRAMTLIELLAVIVIITTLVAAAIPILSPANDDRRLREASRGLNTFITGAQTRAIASGRPFGIALKRLSEDTGRSDPTDPDNDNGVCLEVFYVEQPAPFTGFTSSSSVRVAIDQDPAAPPGQALVQFVTRGNTLNDKLPTGWDRDPIPPSFMRPGDVIDVAGTRYEIIDDELNFLDQFGFYKSDSGNPVGTYVTRPINDTGQLLNVVDRDLDPVFPNRFWTQPLRYKLLRQPAPASDQPYQLPEGTAIDLRASGVGVNDYFYVPGIHDNSDGVLIMFTPEGRVDRLSFSQSPNEVLPFDAPVTDNIYLLLGKRENIPAPPVADSDPTLDSAAVAAATTDEQREKLREPVNWLSGNSRWIVIGSQSGRVVTVENAFVDLAGVINNPQPPFQNAVERTEELRCAQILAAREFTHEMSQLGGR